ncbi:MAG: hypothetical protein QOC67_2634, partial [Pseudonocardiales bacterium]|nr:hypothetical protein [Pseudonocardiales bacterium]
VVAIIWGIVVFGERARGGFWLVGTVSGAVLIGVGTVLLARSPLLAGERTDAEATL